MLLDTIFILAFVVALLAALLVMRLFVWTIEAIWAVFKHNSSNKRAKRWHD